MKSRKKKQGLFHRILNRYKRIPKQLHSERASERSKAQKLIALTICVPVLIYCAAYMGFYKFNQSRIEQENEQYRMLYATPEPSATPTALLTSASTAVPTTAPTDAPSAEPTLQPTLSPTATPVPTPSPMPSFEVAPDATLSPYATPDENTLVYALETPSPIQDTFSGLLELNPETIGYLTVGTDISLPVVHRKNDNEFYLNHNFEGEESNGGTLFLDGSNLLTPEDMSLLVYGHNMRNGTMFHALTNYENYDYLVQNSLVYFDTLHKNRTYVPFAVFSASMDEGSRNYIDIRQFAFDQDSFDLYIMRMQRLSIWDIPIDVQYGDSVLLLVTCEYTHDNGRFVVALRALRDDEAEDQMQHMVKYARPN